MSQLIPVSCAVYVKSDTGRKNIHNIPFKGSDSFTVHGIVLIQYTTMFYSGYFQIYCRWQSHHIWISHYFRRLCPADSVWNPAARCQISWLYVETREKGAVAWTGMGSTDRAISGFVGLAHIQQQWGHQLIRSRLSSGEFAERVCYWILGVGGKAVRLSVQSRRFTGSDMTVIQLLTNWLLLKTHRLLLFY